MTNDIAIQNAIVDGDGKTLDELKAMLVENGI